MPRTDPKYSLTTQSWQNKIKTKVPNPKTFVGIVKSSKNVVNKLSLQRRFMETLRHRNLVTTKPKLERAALTTSNPSRTTGSPSTSSAAAEVKTSSEPSSPPSAPAIVVKSAVGSLPSTLANPTSQAPSEQAPSKLVEISSEELERRLHVKDEEIRRKDEEITRLRENNRQLLKLLKDNVRYLEEVGSETSLMGRDLKKTGSEIEKVQMRTRRIVNESEKRNL